jgi:hypothetical protein
VLTSIYNFNPIDGALPIGDLYEHGGFLYGTAFHGGMSSKGTAYKLSLPGYVFTKLIDFNGTNGSNPSGAFIIHMPTGLQSVAESEIGIYPNPVISDLMIILPEKFTSGVKVSITDLAGKAVREKSFSYLPQKSLQLDVQTLQSGVYFLNLESGDESLKQKFLKY